MECDYKRIRVLNLVINGLPSILSKTKQGKLTSFNVLNLVINGLPSIPPGSIPFIKGYNVLF